MGWVAGLRPDLLGSYSALQASCRYNWEGRERRRRKGLGIVGRERKEKEGEDMKEYGGNGRGREMGRGKTWVRGGRKQKGERG